MASPFIIGMKRKAWRPPAVEHMATWELEIENQAHLKGMGYQLSSVRTKIDRHQKVYDELTKRYREDTLNHLWKTVEREGFGL